MKCKMAFTISLLFVISSCNGNNSSLTTNKNSNTNEVAVTEKKGEFLVDKTYSEPMLWIKKEDTPSRIWNKDSIKQIEKELYGGEIIEVYAVKQGFNVFDTFPGEIYFYNQPENELSFKIVTRPSFIKCVYKNNKFESDTTEFDINILPQLTDLGYKKCVYDENGNSFGLDRLNEEDILYVAINSNSNDNKIYGIYSYNPTNLGSLKAS